MSARLLTDISTAKPQISCRSWDNIVDGTLTLSAGSSVVIPAGTLPVNTLEPGPANSVIKSNGSVTAWSATPTVDSITFSTVSPAQTAFSSYAETVNTQFDWTAPGPISGSSFAKYIRIGSVVFMVLQGNITAATKSSGAWTLTGIPVGFRPAVATTGSMPYSYTSGGTGVHSGQQQMLINTDGTAVPFGNQGTASAADPNATTYFINACTIVYGLI